HDTRLGWGAAPDWMFGRRRQGFLQANRRNTIMRLRRSAAPDRKSGRPCRHSYKQAAATPAISFQDKAELIEAGLALLPFENSQMDVPEGQMKIGPILPAPDEINASRAGSIRGAALLPGPHRG